MSENLLQTIRLLEQRAQYLEQEATLLRRELAQVADELATASPIVARYVIEGETYEITQADVEAIQARLIKPRAERTIHTLILAEKMAQHNQHLSREVKAQQLQQAIEASRAAAIADGTAIENDWEAAIDD
jgi:hypothetical protein